MCVRVWRLTKARFAAKPLDGEGARAYGGRWNLPGTAIVYTSGSLALAQLEALVQVDRSEAPTDLVAVELEIPGRIAIESVDQATLPRGWTRFPAPAALAKIGTEWASAAKTAILRVPSAVVPREFNYLLNPAHPASARIRVVGRERVLFDARLFEREVPGTRRTDPAKRARSKRRAGRSKKR